MKINEYSKGMRFLTSDQGDYSPNAPDIFVQEKPNYRIPNLAQSFAGGGSVETPKRGLVDEPGSYAGEKKAESLGGGLYETTYKKGSKSYYTSVYDRETGKNKKTYFGTDKEAAAESLKEQKADRPKTKFEKIQELKDTKGKKEFQKITDKIDNKFSKIESKGYTNLREFRDGIKNLVTKDKFRNQIQIQEKINKYMTDKFKDIQDVNTSSMEKALDKYNKAGGKERGTIGKIANEFGINKNTFELNIQKTGRKTIPIKYGSEYEKRKAVKEKRTAAEKKFSDLSFESKMSGTDAVQKSHMDDLYSRVVRADTLGYAPARINQEILKQVDPYLNQLYKNRDKLLKDKPEGYKQAVEEINQKGIKVAQATDGYKSFQIEQPDGKKYQFGVEPGKTIDPTGITKGKQIKGNVEKVKFEGGKKPTATLTSDPVDQYFFEKNRQAVMESQSKVTKKKMKSIANSLKIIGCGTAKSSGGRIGFKDGATCLRRGIDKVNKGNLKDGSEIKNFSKLVNTTGAKTVQGVLKTLGKIGIVGEAGLIGLESAIRMGMGDTFSESIKRSTDYLIPGDQTLSADMDKISRELDPGLAKIYGNVQNYYNKQQKLKSFENQKAELENLNASEFDYLPNASEFDSAIETAKKDLDSSTVTLEDELFSERVLDVASDRSKAKSFFSNQRLKAKQMGGVGEDISGLNFDLRGIETQPERGTFDNFRQTMSMSQEDLLNFYNDAYFSGNYGDPKTKEALKKAQKGYNDAVKYIEDVKNAPLSKNAAEFGLEQTYGFNPIVGSRKVNEPMPYKRQSSYIPSPQQAEEQKILMEEMGRLGAAGGGIAKLAGKRFGRPPESGPEEGLASLMKYDNKY